MRDLTATGEGPKKRKDQPKPVIKQEEKTKVVLDDESTILPKEERDERAERLEQVNKEIAASDPVSVEYEVQGPDGSENIEKEPIVPSDEPSEPIETAGGKKLEELEDHVEIDPEDLEDTTDDDYPDSTVPPCLLFQKPVFNEGVNVTFRKGPKWSRYGIKRNDRLVIAKTPEEGKTCRAIGTAIVQHISGPRFLSNFSQSAFDLEHDGRCRTREGLIEVMKETYGEFDPEKDVVVMIQFVIQK